MAGILEEKLGPLTFTVRLPDGRLWKRHIVHIRSRLPTSPESAQPVREPPPTSPLVTEPRLSATSATTTEEHAVVPHSASSQAVQESGSEEPVPAPVSPGPVGLRRSNRQQKIPSRLDL